MRIGIFSGAAASGGIDEVAADAAAVAEAGFSSYWLANVFGLDALTTLAVIAKGAPGIELGTAVVPTYPRHPMALAQQALTTQAASGGRLLLGIGPSHQVVIEGMFKQSFAKPLRHVSEYLDVLLPLLAGEGVNVQGETLGGAGRLDIPGAAPVPVLIAALGPKMLELAGRRTAGTITWCVGPETLKGYTVPSINAAAEAAGREQPRVVAGFPISVSDDPQSVRERVARQLAIYGQLPSYRAMLDREGAEGLGDLVITGSEDQVLEGLQALAGAGVTDFAASEVGATPDERERTRAALRAFLG